MLRETRADTLATFEAYLRALPGLAVPCVAALNPPLWELGHIGWFQEFWIGRNPQRHLGLQADPDAARPEGVRPGAEPLYHSSRVAHDTRWHLRLPDVWATQDDLAAHLAQTLHLLAGAPHDDTALHFHRLALKREDMHHEAAPCMVQSQGLPIGNERGRPPERARSSRVVSLGRAPAAHRG